MQYVFQKNYTVRPNSWQESSPKTVLLVEPDPEACAVYTRHLAEIDVVVLTCGSLSELLHRITESRADVLIINPMGDIKQSTRLLQQVRRQHPNLPVITIGGRLDDRSLDALMAAGVTLHINRYLSQPRDLYLAVEQILS